MVGLNLCDGVAIAVRLGVVGVMIIRGCVIKELEIGVE